MTDDPDFGPGCGNPDCICRNPYAWPVCAEFQGVDEDRFCPRCGWTRDRHPAHVHRLHDGPISEEPVERVHGAGLDRTHGMIGE